MVEETKMYYKVKFEDISIRVFKEYADEIYKEISFVDKEEFVHFLGVLEYQRTTNDEFCDFVQEKISTENMYTNLKTLLEVMELEDLIEYAKSIKYTEWIKIMESQNPLEELQYYI